jgi:hypothetical protein
MSILEEKGIPRYILALVFLGLVAGVALSLLLFGADILKAFASLFRWSYTMT